MELYIIRHGQSTNNATDEVDRVSDPELTSLGKQQAELIAAYLADRRNHDKRLNLSTGAQRNGDDDVLITQLYCSAMHRALQTAQPIARALGVPAEVWIDIHEHGGMYLEQPDGVVGFPGKTRAEIATEFPDYVLPDTITEAGWYDQKIGEESLYAAQGRAIKVAGELRRRASSDERIAIVSHGTFIDALLKALFNQLPSNNLYYTHYNTAFTRIDFFGEKEPLVVRHLNRVAHLPIEFLT